MIRQYELVETVKGYDPNANESLLNRAYVFSMKAHGSQTRASGDPYFSHPLEVAGILTDMRLDSNTIITALLHDVVEDTGTTTEEIEELFGPEIAKLVDGVTKLSKIEIQTESERQAENFRKFLIAVSDDIRVLLVKLADRLHNMRTIHHIKKPEKRSRIAMETMDIYAPLAERMGMRKLKDELEDISFQQVNPEAYDTILSRLEFLREKGEGIAEEISKGINNALKENGIEAEVFGREKTPYSIWSKMERNHIDFEELADIIAFRVIVDDVDTCYKALGVIHKNWPMVPDRFDDYISTPKRNGYQSIHTAVIGPRQVRIEVQIRTQQMHNISENGVASHWQYKTGGDKNEGVQYKWIRDLLEILDQASTPEEFLEHTKLDMFQDQVFCFTPKGELISLPLGSSVVDFAYAVHTEIGDTCVGGKVNGRPVPLRYQLHNGDQVDIVRSKVRRPSPKWESFVLTGKARSSIRRFRRQQQRGEFEQLGKTLLERAFSREKLDFNEEALELAIKALKFSSLEDLYLDVGRGMTSDQRVLTAVYPGVKFKNLQKARPEPIADWDLYEDDHEHAIPIKGLTPGLAVHLADCCHPVSGDRILGIRVKGEGIMVHTMDCDQLLEQTDDPDRWMDLSWQSYGEEPEFYTGRLELIVVNEAGALANIAQITANHGGNISNLKMPTRDPEFFTMIVDVEVRDSKHLKGIITALRALKVISSANRM